MTKEVKQSIAFAALSRQGRHVYALLAAEIASRRTESVAITSADMMAALSVSSSSSVASSVRELRALGLISVAKGKRCVGVYSFSTDWQAIVVDLEEAKSTAIAARLPPKGKPKSRHHVTSSKKRRKVEVQPDAVEAEVEREPRVRPVTLPVLPWPSPTGLRLLEERL